jgi:ABC-2 type transport system ATP-binding protein
MRRERFIVSRSWRERETMNPGEQLMSRTEPAVETKGLTKKYGSLVALDRLTMTVERGEIMGFVGPNGAGKTTTIKILVGLARPTGGSAFVAGADCVAEARRLQRLVGYMPDTFGSYDNMRVFEYLDFFGAAFGIPRRERGRRIGEVLETAGAGTFGDLYVEALSHGMKQRVAIARTLLHDPEVLILDEPANGLDPQARIEMRQLLLDLAARGKTLLVTSHVLPELARVCHRVAIITRGKLRAIGTLPEITRQLSQLRPMEVLLTDATQIERVAEVVRQHIEPGAEVTASATEAVVRFRTAKCEEELAGLLAALVAAGLGVTQFREVQTDLEEAFMTVARADDAGPEEVSAIRTGKAS